MRKFFVTMMTVVLVIALVGCGSKANTNTTDKADAAYDESTLGGKLANKFVEGINAGKNMDTIADQLVEESQLDCVIVEAVPGYLNGFTEEIEGFSKGVQFSPMIGSIAFVGYIFETDDADTLMTKLKSVADPRWNICTEAAETVCVKQGNYVFFAMCPGEED